MSRRFFVLAAVVAAAGVAVGRIGAATPAVVTFPSAVNIPPTGKLPAGAGRSLTLNEALGGDDAALVVVSNGRRVGCTVDTKSLAPLVVQVRFRHFVRFG